MIGGQAHETLMCLTLGTVVPRRPPAAKQLLPVIPAPATRDIFDCDGQSTNTAHAGIYVSALGDYSGQSTNTVNEGFDVSCSGDGGIWGIYLIAAVSQHIQ